MEINADFAKRVVIDTRAAPWVPSPLPGVERKMLDRIGEEIARATSIVRYAPESHFSPHAHPGGEEFLVLEGVFSDEHGDYGAGMYVRNPCGSSHRPFSARGCTIFVKLWQMVATDQEFVRTDTRGGSYLPGPVGSLEALSLHRIGAEEVSILRTARGFDLTPSAETTGEEILVLAGTLEDDLGTYDVGTWIRNPAAQARRLFSRGACTFYRKTGHLAGPIEAPGASR